MLKTVDEPLSKEMMIQMNMILKRGTSYEDNPAYNVGGFKVRENGIGMINPFKTTKSADVETELDALLEKFQNKGVLSFEDIVEFHVCFERIHPFGDGNGRTGRVLINKIALANGYVPFVIPEEKRDSYMKLLAEVDVDGMKEFISQLMHDEIERMKSFQIDMTKLSRSKKSAEKTKPIKL